jgi:hypothetical protein
MNDNTNGKPAAKQELQRPLKQSRSAMYEAGLRAFHETSQEVEDLKGEIDRQRLDLQARDLEIKSLQERIDTMRDDHASALAARDSRVHECEAARDLAVSEKVALETIIASLRQVLKLAPQKEAGEDGA